MRRSILISFLIAFGSTACFLAQESDQMKALFKTANTAFENGDLEDAIANYEIVETIYTSPALYGNLGNAYFRTGNIAKAILNFERALKLDPRNEDITFNLDFAKNLTKDKLEENESDQLSGFLRSISTSYPANTWAIISIICAFIFFICLTLVFSIKKVGSKRTFFYASGLFAIMLLSSIYFAYDSKSIVSTSTHAIITNSKVDVKSEPNPNSVELFVLHEGSKVLVLGSKNGWLHIQLPNGTKGWLSSSTLEKI